MRIALDTDILAYAEGVNGRPMQTRARDLIERLPEDGVVLPAQILGELFNVLTRKAAWAPDKARAALLDWVGSFLIVETTQATVLAAADLSADHQLSVWDAVILTASAEAGCRLLLSEDLQDGFTWRGVTVANPFAAAKHALLNALLEEPPSS